METEFEAKFYPINKEEYRKRLKLIGAKLVIPERLMRRSLADKNDNPQIDCHYIRVRDEGNLVRLSAKIHAVEGGELSDQKEVDIEVPSFDKTIEILKRAGLKFNYYQETKREEWEYDGAQITIDTWPGLESYSEIEASSEDKVKEIAEKLKLDWTKKQLTSIDPIFAKVYGISEERALKKISTITFENNPFEGMPKKTFPKL